MHSMNPAAKPAIKRAIRALARGLVPLLCLAILGGCASSSGKSYTRDEARRTQSVQRGTIVSLEEVTIEQDATLLGPGIGGAVGGVIGSTMGAKAGRLLATLGGAAIGSTLGALGEKAVRTEKAHEFMIDLDDGKTISVVQAIDDTPFSVGSRVRVLYSSGNRARVVLAQGQ
jgi:outer membrane lipoprotein SlyB